MASLQSPIGSRRRKRSPRTDLTIQVYRDTIHIAIGKILQGGKDDRNQATPRKKNSVTLVGRKVQKTQASEPSPSRRLQEDSRAGLVPGQLLFAAIGRRRLSGR